MNIPFKDISAMSTERLTAIRACDVIDSLIISFSKHKLIFLIYLEQNQKIDEFYSLTVFSFARSIKHGDRQMFDTKFCIYKMYRHDDTERHRSAYFQTNSAHHAEDVSHGSKRIFGQSPLPVHIIDLLHFFRSFQIMHKNNGRLKT